MLILAVNDLAVNGALPLYILYSVKSVFCTLCSVKTFFIDSVTVLSEVWMCAVRRSSARVGRMTSGLLLRAIPPGRAR